MALTRASPRTASVAVAAPAGLGDTPADSIHFSLSTWNSTPAFISLHSFCFLSSATPLIAFLSLHPVLPVSHFCIFHPPFIMLFAVFLWRGCMHDLRYPSVSLSSHLRISQFFCLFICIFFIYFSIYLFQVSRTGK